MHKPAMDSMAVLILGITLTASGGTVGAAATATPGVRTASAAAAPRPAPAPAPAMWSQPEPSSSTFGTGLFRTARFTPDGSQVLVVAPGRLLLYPADDIQGTPRVVTLGGDIADAVHSPDGSLLAVGFVDGDVQVLDAATFEPRVTLERAVSQWAGLLAFSPDNAMLVVGHDIPNVDVAADNFVYDLASGKAVLTIPGRRASAYRFSPDGSRLISAGSDTVVTAWDLATGEPVGSITLDADPFQGSVELLFSSDGTVLFAVENNAGVFAIDPGSMQTAGPFADDGQTDGYRDLALSPDEDVLYVGTTNRIIVFDTALQAASGTIDLVSGGFQPPDHRFDLSPDGGFMVVLRTRHSGNPAQRLERWDVDAKALLQANTSSTFAASHVDISPDGTEVIASHAGGRVMVWDIGGADPALVSDHTDSYLGWFMDDPAAMVVGTGADEPLDVVIRPRQDGADEAVGDVRFDPKLIAWSNGVPIMSRRMAYSRATGRIAVAHDGALSVVNVTDGQATFSVEDAGVAEALDFSPDGSLLAFVGEDVLQLYAAGTGELLQRLDIEDVRGAVAFTADGRRFAVAAGRFRSDVRIHLFDVGAAQPFQILNPDADSRALAFNGDGSILAIGADGLIWFYDLVAEEYTAVIETGEQLVCMAFGPDDRSIIGGTGRGTLVRVGLGS